MYCTELTLRCTLKSGFFFWSAEIPLKRPLNTNLAQIWTVSAWILHQHETFWFHRFSAWSKSLIVKGTLKLKIDSIVAFKFIEINVNEY